MGNVGWIPAIRIGRQASPRVVSVRIGKREQIVGMAIGGLVAIGALHFFVYSPRASQLRQVHAEVEELKKRASGLKQIDNQVKFNEYKKMNEELKTEYADVFSSMTLTEPGIFAVTGNVDSIVLDPPPKAGATPDVIRNMKQRQLMDQFLATSNTQIDQVLAQLRTLMKFDRRISAEASGKTEFLFLSEPSSWQMIHALPPEVYSTGSSDIGRLVDVLSDLAQTQGMLNVISPIEQPDLYARQRNAYEVGLAKLGLNNEIYRILTPASLTAKGDYVPLFHKLAFAMLIEDAMATDPAREIAGSKFTREQLYQWLEISVPVRPLQGNALGELYFVYNQLALLTSLMELMVKNEIAQVYDVRFGELSYVVAQPTMAKGDINAKPERPAPTVLQSPFVLPVVEDLRRQPVPPADSDTGICTLVTIQLRASNANATRFIYDYLARNSLSELDEIQFLGTTEGTDVFCEVKLMHVFRLVNVSKQIGAAKAVPGAPAQPPPGTD